jgi:hypothetical protein
MKNLKPIISFCLFTIIIYGCKQPFEPPAIKATNNYLVVDGMLINSIDSPTNIILSRTRNLIDTVITSPEKNAKITVEGSGGENFTLVENAPGNYFISKLNLNIANTYRLKIITASGGQYLSDYVPVKQTKPIDSLTWKQPGDLTISVNSHDPSNNTKYYKWDFVETWQYRSQIEGDLDFSNGLMYYLDSITQIHNCWRTANSTDIIIGSTAALNQDIISDVPVAHIVQNDERGTIRYSILVKQYALTQEAHRYLQVLKKNTQQLGSLFDAQPAELIGNIHSVTNPNEPVVGFVSASNMQEKRIFIKNNELNNWAQNTNSFTCDILFLGVDPNNYLVYKYSDPNYIPIYFITGGGLAITKRTCVDCRLRGGVNKKTSFW